TPENEEEFMGALRRHGLNLAMVTRPFELDTIRKTVSEAKRLGADFIWIQPADAFTPLDKVVELCVEGRKMANDEGLPFFVEVHRNNFTETIPQTLQLI